MGCGNQILNVGREIRSGEVSLAFAQAGTIPSSRVSDRAYESAKPGLARDLEAQGLSLGSPVFLRITKAPAELTAYVQDANGVYKPFRTWPVCSVSGTLGPKKAVAAAITGTRLTTTDHMMRGVLSEP